MNSDKGDFYRNYENTISSLANLRITPLDFFTSQINFLAGNNFDLLNPSNSSLLYMSFLKLNLEHQSLFDYFEEIQYNNLSSNKHILNLAYYQAVRFCQNKRVYIDLSDKLSNVKPQTLKDKF